MRFFTLTMGSFAKFGERKNKNLKRAAFKGTVA